MKHARASPAFGLDGWWSVSHIELILPGQSPGKGLADDPLPERAGIKEGVTWANSSVYNAFRG